MSGPEPPATTPAAQPEELREARDPGAPPARLAELYSRRAPDLSAALAENPNTPRELLAELIPEHAGAFSRNPALPLLLLEGPDFFWGLGVDALVALLGAGGLPGSARGLLLSHPDDDTRAALARRPELPEAALYALAGDRSAAVREAVAGNPAAPQGLILALADDEHPAVLRQAYRAAPVELRRRITERLRRRLAAEPTAERFAPLMLSHPLFGVSGNTYQWYSEHTYRTSEAALRDLWRDFEALWELYAPIAGRSAAAWEALYTIARVTWRSFHLPEAERWLRWCVERRPDLAEGWFLLGQMYQDELGEPARAEQAFKLYLQLAPRSVPPNAYLLDGWFIHSHAYEPSAVEALTRLARLSRGRARRRRLLRAAIALAPDHHLAPYVELADDLFEAGEDLHRVAALLTRAEAVFEATPWRGWPYDRPCEEMVRQEDWARANYPLRYRWHERTRTLLAERFARLGAAFWRRLGDARAAQRLLSRVLRRYPRPVAERRGPWDYWSFDPRPSYEVMLDIVLRGQRDFWQARDLCERLLALDPGNAVARAALAEMPAQP